MAINHRGAESALCVSSWALSAVLYGAVLLGLGQLMMRGRVDWPMNKGKLLSNWFDLSRYTPRGRFFLVVYLAYVLGASLLVPFLAGRLRPLCV